MITYDVLSNPAVIRVNRNNKHIHHETQTFKILSTYRYLSISFIYFASKVFSLQTYYINLKLKKGPIVNNT